MKLFGILKSELGCIIPWIVRRQLNNLEKISENQNIYKKTIWANKKAQITCLYIQPGAHLEYKKDLINSTTIIISVTEEKDFDVKVINSDENISNISENWLSLLLFEIF